MCAVMEGETIAASAVIEDKTRLISKKTHPFWLDCTTRGRTEQDVKGETMDRYMIVIPAKNRAFTLK